MRKSKTQKMKDDQDYIKKPQQCNNCQHYKSEFVDMPADYYRPNAYRVEKHKRCGIGDFAVQSSASCKLYCSRIG